MPSTIRWAAPGGGPPDPRDAKAMLLGLWDGAAGSALRIDLWTRDMRVDEMAEFFFQSLMGMADTYDRATHEPELTGALKTFAKEWRKRALEAAQKSAAQ